MGETMTQARTVQLPLAKADTAPPADRTSLTGCPWHDVKAMLRGVGLRPTRQRMALRVELAEVPVR